MIFCPQISLLVGLGAILVKLCKSAGVKHNYWRPYFVGGKLFSFFFKYKDVNWGKWNQTYPMPRENLSLSTFPPTSSERTDSFYFFSQYVGGRLKRVGIDPPNYVKTSRYSLIRSLSNELRGLSIFRENSTSSFSS